MLSVGSYGCNLSCQYCQNAAISQEFADRPAGQMTQPAALLEITQQHHCPALAFTYNEPLMQLEYIRDLQPRLRERGVLSIGVSAGFVGKHALRDFASSFDALNIDLKALDASFYRNLCAADLQPVLDSLVYMRTHSHCWLELTCLIIPGYNDQPAQAAALARWIARELGADTPLHLSAFRPAHKMSKHQRTDPAALRSLRRIACENGLQYVYTGNILDNEGSTTWCPNCHISLIERQQSAVANHLAIGGRCPACHEEIPGIWNPPQRRDQ